MRDVILILVKLDGIKNQEGWEIHILLGMGWIKLLLSNRDDDKDGGGNNAIMDGLPCVVDIPDGCDGCLSLFWK